MRSLLASFVVLVLAFTALPAQAEVTQAELAAARAEVNEISAELEDEMAELDAAINKKFEFENRISAIQEDLALREREIALASFKARDQARSMYVSAGSSSAGGAVVSPEGITVLGAKTAYLDAVVDIDQDAVNRLVFLQDDRSQLQDEISLLLAQQEDITAELDARANEILAQLGAANDRYQTLYSQWQEEEAARRAAAAAAARRAAAEAAAAQAAATGFSTSANVDPSGRTCPVAGPHSFSDTWGAPRSGGRGHTGVDMVAAMGTPLVAIENGYIWSPNWHWAGGHGLYLRGDSGDIYYYAHLQGYAGGIVDGVRVGVGQVVGYNGNSGNAAVPHLHLGYQPGGGPLTNPYQLMVKLCR